MEEVQEAEDRSDVAFEELKEKGLVEIYVFWERDKMMLKKKIRFTSHAEDKLTRLVKIGVTKEKVIETIKNPEKVVGGYYEREIAQHLLTNDLILRVVYEEHDEEIIIITIYPGERRRYG